MKFEETYKELLERYSLNEGVFDAIGKIAKATAKSITHDEEGFLLSPFHSKYGMGIKRPEPVLESEADVIIEKIKNDFLRNSNLFNGKKLKFFDSAGNELGSYTYSDIVGKMPDKMTKDWVYILSKINSKK